MNIHISFRELVSISTLLLYALHWGQHCEDTENTWTLKTVQDIVDIYCLKLLVLKPV